MWLNSTSYAEFSNTFGCAGPAACFTWFTTIEVLFGYEWFANGGIVDESENKDCSISTCVYVIDLLSIVS